jgi:hypothetical protein
MCSGVVERAKRIEQSGSDLGSQGQTSTYYLAMTNGIF